MRWLGFVQGALWQLDLCSISELKGMNRGNLDHQDAVVQEGAIYGFSAHMTPEVKERLQNLASDSTRHGLIQEIAAEVLAEED